jgi:hypothetical protein
MASFMLITEGPTDQEVIEAILTGYFGEEPDFPFRRPLRDATDESRQGSPGGWERVFEHCEHGEELLREDLQINDYLIIQIDTDCGEERNFGVPPTVNGQDRPVMDIIMDVRKLLITKLGEDFYRDFQHRILFAISVRSLECWLLPLHIKKPKKTAIKKSSQIQACANRLEKYIEEYCKIKYKKDIATYRVLAKDFLDKANIKMTCERNVSFKVFIESLPEV